MILAGGAMYLILKALHVVAVALFLGNIITGVFWRFHAERSGDPKYIGLTFEGISRSDRLFTIPGVILLVASGIWAAIEGGLPILGTGWILWALVLLTLSGVIFSTSLGPVQRQIAALARAPGQFDWARYKGLVHRWDIWGAVATLTPLAALALMVLKPQLPAL
jgi:uncharacterized membrane protein